MLTACGHIQHFVLARVLEDLNAAKAMDCHSAVALFVPTYVMRPNQIYCLLLQVVVAFILWAGARVKNATLEKKRVGRLL